MRYEPNVHSNGSGKHIDSFDYSSFPPSVVSFLKGEANRIRREAGSSIIRIGKGLLAAKRYLSHGDFLRWVESETGIPARTAQAYMQVAQWAANKNAPVEHLPPSLLYVISSRNAPEQFVAEVLKRVQAGERLTLSDVQCELQAIRHQRRLARHDLGIREARQCAGTPELTPASMNVEQLVLQAIALLARVLPGRVFALVRDMMTNDLVIHDRDLGQKIAAAFTIIDKLSHRRVSDLDSVQASPGGHLVEVRHGLNGEPTN
jgi:hypothetical protein